MSKSQTISVTIPVILKDDLQKAADKIGISRSRFICNLLLQWQEIKNNPPIVTTLEQTNFEPKVNECPNRDDGDGTCSVFDHVCNAPQSEARTCVGYPKPENQGK